MCVLGRGWGRGRGQSQRGGFCQFGESPCSFPKLQLPSFGTSYHEILGVWEHMGLTKLLFYHVSLNRLQLKLESQIVASWVQKGSWNIIPNEALPQLPRPTPQSFYQRTWNVYAWMMRSLTSSFLHGCVTCGLFLLQARYLLVSNHHPRAADHLSAGRKDTGHTQACLMQCTPCQGWISVITALGAGKLPRIRMWPKGNQLVLSCALALLSERKVTL